jgi:hypothetical protein
MGVHKHGYAKRDADSATYRTWLSIHHRCKQTRGVVTRWGSFEQFLEDVGEKPDGHELVRLSVNRPWGPKNAQWVSKSDARRMRSNVQKITYRGRSQTLGQWAEKYGVRPQTVRERLRRGWSVGEALTTPTS